MIGDQFNRSRERLLGLLKVHKAVFALTNDVMMNPMYASHTANCQ